MATIYNTIEKTAGVPRGDISVSIELVWDTSESPVAYSDSIMIKGPFISRTDASGTWEVDEIVDNDSITPIDSLYQITESIDSEEVVYYISVPSGATPTFWVGDLLVTDLPTWVV